MKIKHVLVVGILAVLAACSSDPDYTKPGVSKDQYNADMSSCLAEAQANNPTTGRADLAIVFKKRGECMVRKGYVAG